MILNDFLDANENKIDTGKEYYYDVEGEILYIDTDGDEFVLKSKDTEKFEGWLEDECFMLYPIFKIEKDVYIYSIKNNEFITEKVSKDEICYIDSDMIVFPKRNMENRLRMNRANYDHSCEYADMIGLGRIFYVAYEERDSDFVSDKLDRYFKPYIRSKQDEYNEKISDLEKIRNSFYIDENKGDVI